MGTDVRAGLPAILNFACRMAGQRILPDRLQQFDRDLNALNTLASQPFKIFVDAWISLGLEGQPVLIQNLSPAHLPAVGFDDVHGWFIVQSQDHDGNWQIIRKEGEVAQTMMLDRPVYIGLPKRSTEEKPKPSAFSLVRSSLFSHRSVLLDAVLATFIVSALALASSLYAMQVYDRVIPNHGYQTLFVLTVGIVMSVLIELVLKQTRSHTIDKISTRVDEHMSAWFFNRMLGVRLESRPNAVGTLASQIKGFEMVRGVLTSTSLFVLADVPFAILFIAVISFIGGSVALVPIIALPISLASGLLFQRAIQASSRNTIHTSNRKAGLLVEAIDGAEMLKANGGEWGMQARWNHLLGQIAQAEQFTKTHTTLSQNLTVAMQQLSYVALIALGASHVAENKMTMGALIACSIISNRALAPIVQLPGVMVQWALAKAALEGLDQIIRLPNEADHAHKTLIPRFVEAGLRFESVGFTYGAVKRVVLGIEKLDIRPGELVGLVGAIGSGKSTLLKIASGLYRPMEGRVFLGGIDLATLAPSIAREVIGYLPQDVRLFSGTLRDNILLGLPDPGEDAIMAAAQRTGLIDLILGQPAGLSLELTEGGRGVSGGQKQLIALTRIVLAKPRIWLLDEPTGAMDSMTEARVLKLLREVAAEGVTLIVTTHKSALLPLLDRLVVLNGGRIQMDGPRDAVLSKLSGRPKVSSGEAATS